jgi:hypothetical protein
MYPLIEDYVSKKESAASWFFYTGYTVQ